MIRILLTLALAANILAAQDNPPVQCSDLVGRVFEVAGVNGQIAAIPGQIKNQLANQFQHDTKMSDADKQKLAATMSAAFLPEKIDSELRQDFFKSCDVDMLRAVLAGLTSPLAVRMRALEAFAESPRAFQEGADYARTLAQHPPARERMVLMLRMDASLGITKSTMDITMASARGIGAAFGGLSTEASAQLQSKESSDAMHGAVLVNLLFTYRDVTDQDLTSYIELYETPTLKRFNDELEKAFVACIARRSEELGQEIRKMAPAQ